MALRSPRLAFPHRLPLWIHSPPTSLAFPLNTSIIQYHLVVFQEGGWDTSVSKTDTQMRAPSACIPGLCLKGTVCCAKSLQSCLTLCDAMDCSPPGSSVHGIFQEYWSGLPFLTPGDLPDSGIKPASLASPASAGGFFTTNTTWEAQEEMYFVLKMLSCGKEAGWG